MASVVDLNRMIFDIFTKVRVTSQPEVVLFTARKSANGKCDLVGETMIASYSSLMTMHSSKVF